MNKFKWTTDHSVLLTLLLGSLKLWNILDISWWIVTLPILLGVYVVIGIVLLAIIGIAIAGVVLLLLLAYFMVEARVNQKSTGFRR